MAESLRDGPIAVFRQEAHRRRIILQLHQEVHKRRAGHHRLHVSVGCTRQHIHPIRHGPLWGRRAAGRHRSWRRTRKMRHRRKAKDRSLVCFIPSTLPRQWAQPRALPSPVPDLTRPAPLGWLPGPHGHGSRAPCRGSRPSCCSCGAGLALRSGAGGQSRRGRDRRGRARGRGGAGGRRLGVRAGAAAAHQAGGRGGEQSRFRFRSRYAHTRVTSHASRFPTLLAAISLCLGRPTSRCRNTELGHTD